MSGDVVWITSLVSLFILLLIAAVVTWWSTAPKPAPSAANSANAQAHHALHAQNQPSHNDFFTNQGQYMPRTHCLTTQAGTPDWPWIIALIGLSLGVIAAYVRIYLFWCRSYFSEEPQDRNPKLMDLAQMFLWCAVAGYAGSVLMFFWPGYRLLAVCLLFLNLWAWRFCFNLSDFRSAFKANRYFRMTEQDPLTKLYSRVGINRRLSKNLESNPGPDLPLTLLYLDFDRFKMVNDSMGHLAGDKLLQVIAERIRKTIQAQPSEEGVEYHVGRMGGDEFVILVEGCNDRDKVNALANRLHTELTCSYSITGRSVNSSVSIGITNTEFGYQSGDEMLRDADTAMYEAKKAGKARSVWFNQTMHEAVREAVDLEQDLRHAIENDELFLTYQPLLDLESGKIAGFESLIRWRHPQRGLIRPDQFIPIAEDSLLIRPIGRWVLREAIKQAKAWRKRFPELAQGVMNVNLSRVQFKDPQLIDFITQTLDEYGLPYDALCLEITESTMMQDNAASIELLHQFQRLGIKLAMDDFGTGYSSLSHLHEFPLDSLKIDRSFIANLSNNRDYAAVIHAITTLAGNLGFTVVAEGVESIDQIAELQALSCHKAQGYFFHKPAEPAVIEAYLSDREQRGREGAQTA